MPDKYSAFWISHTKIVDFGHCPRSYYLKNEYKDPQTRHKLQIVTPPLVLGQAVHEVLEALSVLPTDERFNEPLLERYETAWSKFSRQVFDSSDQEVRYKDRGTAMIRTVIQSPGPLAKAAVKIKQDLPQFWLSEADQIILCGKIDWLEYLPETDSVHIIDFKTSKTEEDVNSLQLPIYHLLVHYCQKRQVTKASYWYLEQGPNLTEKTLPDLVDAQERVLQAAKQIKLAKQLDRFKCPQGEAGCRYCRPFERLLAGEGTFIGEGGYGQDLYVLEREVVDERESEIL